MNKKLYQVVIDFINEEITRGNLSIGDLIPSESQLSKKLNVSVGTVRKAIDILENNRQLYRHHGKGTYVSDYGFDNRMFNFFSYGSQTGSSARIYKTTPIRRKMKASKFIANELHTPLGNDIIYLERVGYIDKDNPVMIEKSWWIADIVEGIQDLNIHIPDLLYALVFQRFEVEIISSKEVLTANIAESRVAKILNINTGDPVIMLNRHSYAKGRGLVEFRITTGRADMFSYTTTIGNHKNI